MSRTWKKACVWMTVLLTAANSASAGRGHFWRGCWSPCGPYTVYQSCAPVNCCEVVVECAPVDCCSGDAAGEPLPAPTGTFKPAQPEPTLATPPAAEPPAPALPADETPPAAVPPLDETPAVEPPADEPAPAPADMPEEAPLAPSDEAPAPPAEPSSEVEDLFKEPAATEPSAPATPPAAEPPAAEPPAAPADKTDDLDDLFKEPEADKKSATSEPAPADPMDKANDKEVEDLFSEPTDKPSQSAATEPRLPVQFSAADSPLRTWTDNTGKYQVRARLVVIGEGYVRLLKESGKYTTVKVERLSAGDLAFVTHQATSQIAGNF